METVTIGIWPEPEPKSPEEETGDKVMETFFAATDNLSSAKLSATARYVIRQLQEVLQTWPDENDNCDGVKQQGDYPQHWSQEKE